jgi:Gpi18-like mannosyltransferase
MPSAETLAPQHRQPSSVRSVHVALVAVIAFYFYRLCWGTAPPDFRDFLFPWYQHILNLGPTAVFARPFSDYTPSYLYLLAATSLAHPLVGPADAIKLLSVAGTGFLALAVADLVRSLGGDARKAIVAFIVPSIALNAALLGQCDAIWSGACVFAVAAAIRKDCLGAAVWSGVAIAFKAQAVFIAPFIAGFLWGRRAPWWCWVAPASVYGAFMLPAWLMGWPASDLATVYLRQASEYHSPGNLANPWIIVTILSGRAGSPYFIAGYIAAAAAAAVIAMMTAGSTERPRALILIALLSSIAIPFLLPKMHERYYFLADSLSLSLLLAAPCRRAAIIFIAVQTASLVSILTYVYFFYHPFPALAAAVVALLAIGAIHREAVLSAPALWRSKVSV